MISFFKDKTEFKRMALAEALDKCFSSAYVPHVLDLIYRYAFDLELAMSDYGGIPYDIYKKITEDLTEVTYEEKYKKREEYGETTYKVFGKLHRLDGPAHIYKRGIDYVMYYINGKRHRTDGPAMIDTDGTRVEYWENDVLHRLDGPAIINIYRCTVAHIHYMDEESHYTTYYIDGKFYFKHEYYIELQIRKLKARLGIPR